MLRLALLLCALVAWAMPAPADEHLIAIDVLLIPDCKMMDVAGAWNAKMREQTPEGFELDETHRPHVTLLQRHITKEDLGAILKAVADLRGAYRVGDLTLTADGLYHIPSGDIGLAGLTIAQSEELDKLQAAVIGAVNPYDAGAGDQSAYVPDPGGTPFNPYLFDYVETFVPAQSGANFNPHVTIGLAPRTWLEEIESLPFNPFEFGVTDIAVYQLGNFGTASLRLD